MTSHGVYDAIILGGGPAGLSAALMLGRSRRRTLVIDVGEPRNRFASHMHAVLGQDGTEPGAFLAAARTELAEYNIEFMDARATDVRDVDGGLEVLVDDAWLRTRALLLASGGADVLPDIEGVAERWGVSVLHCPYCHGWEVRDQRLGMLLTSPLQFHIPLLLRQLSESVTVFCAEPDALDADARAQLSARGITVRDAGLASVGGDGQALEYVVTDGGERVPLDALFVGAPVRPRDDVVAGLDLDRTEIPGGSVLTVDSSGTTSHPRIWAAGNVVTPYVSVPQSMGAGSTAGAGVNVALAHEDAERAAQWHDVAPASYWEERYATDAPVWSGNVNATVAAIVSDMTPGRSLDLGCGEGGDVVWLASRGWNAHGVDIAASAVARGRAAASAMGVNATFEVADLSDWEPSTTYDLVTASFFHSPVALARSEVIRRAAAAVAPEGHILIVTHAAPPPWADEEHVRHHRFLSAREELEELELDGAEWAEVRVEDVERTATAPNGSTATLLDGVILLQRARG